MSLNATYTNFAKAYLLKEATHENANADAGANTHTADQSWIMRDQWLYNTIQIINPGGSLVKIYGSLDGENWVELLSSTSLSVLDMLPDGIYTFMKALRDDVEVVGETVTVIVQSGSAVGR